MSLELYLHTKRAENYTLGMGITDITAHPTPYFLLKKLLNQVLLRELQALP